MRYIVKATRTLPKHDPIHANPNAKAWAVEDTQEGYIATTFNSETLAIKTAKSWNEDSDEA